MTMPDGSESDLYDHTPETVTPTSQDGAQTNTNTVSKQKIAAAFYFPPNNPNRDEREVCFDGAIRVVVPGENKEICADVYGARKVEVKGGIGLTGGAGGLSQLLQTPGFANILRVSLTSAWFICLANFWPIQKVNHPGHVPDASNETSAAHKGKLPAFLFVISNLRRPRVYSQLLCLISAMPILKCSYPTFLPRFNKYISAAMLYKSRGLKGNAIPISSITFKRPSKLKMPIKYPQASVRLLLEALIHP